MAAIALAIGLWVWNAATEPEAVVAEAADRGPSIIVLPFENLSGEPAKAYLAGGITEEILTGLAQFKELFVYARETGARYGAATSYQELHRELGVRYVLEGSVREADGRIRVTARLSETHDRGPAVGVRLRGRRKRRGSVPSSERHRPARGDRGRAALWHHRDRGHAAHAG